MDHGPEERAIARSDEPEARSAARWRGRAVGATHDALIERWPVLASCSWAPRWLDVQRDLGRSPQTVQAYARSLVDYLDYCERAGVDVVVAGRADVAGYLGDLRERPSRRGANVMAIDSAAGLANATLQLRVTVVRLFYDFLVEEKRAGSQSRRARVPLIGRSRRSPRAGGAVGSVAVDPDRRAVASDPRGRRWGAVAEPADARAGLRRGAAP